MDDDARADTWSVGTIDVLVGAIGIDLLEFVVNDRLESLTGREPSIEAAAALREMSGTLDRDARAGRLRHWLTDTGDSPEPRALTWRRRCGGIDVLPATDGTVEQLLSELATHVYPAFLLPEDPDLDGGSRIGWATGWAAGAIFEDPITRRLIEEITNEPAITRTFTHGDGAERSAMVLSSTGRGGPVDLSDLVHRILGGASRGGVATMGGFVSRSLQQLQLVRAALNGAAATTEARISFAGVLLPSAGPHQFADALWLRAATPSDLAMAPAALGEEHTAVELDGTQTTIHHAGDIVAELELPYRVQVSDSASSDTPARWPEGLRNSNALGEVITRLRASLILAVDRPNPTHIAVSWESTHDPLHGPTVGWSNSQSLSRLVPTRLTELEMSNWQNWYQLLSAPAAAKIHIAISRLLRATAERRDAVDLLIDSVVAWENLFGTSEGEPTLRVTASLAILLERDPRKRRALRSELAKIYALRSKAVHGASLPTQAEEHQCLRALEVAIQAVRILLKERQDVLEENDGGGRSLRLLLAEDDTSPH